jgi:hypothetical protein
LPLETELPWNMSVKRGSLRAKIRTRNVPKYEIGAITNAHWLSISIYMFLQFQEIFSLGIGYFVGFPLLDVRGHYVPLWGWFDGWKVCHAIPKEKSQIRTTRRDCRFLERFQPAISGKSIHFIIIIGIVMYFRSITLVKWDPVRLIGNSKFHQLSTLLETCRLEIFP